MDKRTLAVILSVMVISNELMAIPSSENVQDSILVDTSKTLSPVDTVIFQPGSLLDKYSEVTNTHNFETSLSQHPTLGLFKSMVIPGWGQLGNGSYFKAILFAGLDTWLILSAVDNGQQARDYYDQFESTTDIADRNAFHTLYRRSRDDRNKFTWFAVIVTLISMFDAYTDAHLSGFPRANESDLTRIEIAPVWHNRELTMRLSLRF